MKTVWQKNDDSAQRDWFFEFTASGDREYDQYLIPYDILCNIAQVQVLQKARLLDEDEAGLLQQKLSGLYRKWEQGEFTLTEADEDVHSAIERYLTEQAGDTGKKIHAGRSRNDLVVADTRLYFREQIRVIASGWISVIGVLQDLGERYKGVFLPGYTHMQPAMPNSADAWCSGYIEMLADAVRSLQQAYETIDCCPLGSAAGFGVPSFNIDRRLYADLLGFDRIQYAVTSVQLSRGFFELQLLHALQYGGDIFNRLAADVVWYAGADKRFISLDDDQVSGSSIMPQKKNPDVWELIRGSSHEFQALATRMQGLTNNMTSGYHRDLQLVKKFTMDGFLGMHRLCEALKHAVPGIRFNEEICYKALDASLFATHMANELTLEGMPFREAYRKAAEEYTSGAIPAKDELIKSYQHEGAPGRCDTRYFDAALRPATQWLKEEDEKWEKVKAGLLG